MSLLSDIKVMGDILKGGLDAVKASEKLEKVVKESRKEYKEKMTDTDNKLYKDYKKLKDQYDQETDMKKANAMLPSIEAAEVAYLMSLTMNKDLPKAFKGKVQEAIDGYNETNSDEAMNEIFEKAMLRYAKNDKEKEEIRKALREQKKSE